MDDYQSNVHLWMEHCFGKGSGASKVNRIQRFVEEALELAQSVGMSEEDVDILKRYVYDRPVGETRQEVGGVVVTLAGVCNAYEVDMAEAAKAELDRCWVRTKEIRAKNALKPHNSPLPGQVDV